MNEIKLLDSIEKLRNYVEKSGYRGYEPFDGLSSPFSALSCGNLLLKRVLQQAVRRIPINLRPLLLIQKQESTKGRGYLAQGYMTLYKASGKPEYADRAKEMLVWLDANKSPNYKNHSWANHFDVAFRGGYDPAHEPIIVWTSIVGQAFLEAYELFKNEKYLDIARSVSRFILDDLPREESNGGVCISYIHSYQRSIHNANMLGAAFLSRYASIAKDAEAATIARKAMTYSCNSQLPDGSWWYGESEKYHWVDNFHTGYNLDSLKTYIETSGDRSFEVNLARGLEYYKENFFLDRRIPKYYNDKTYPIDIQCAAQSVETLTLFGTTDKEAMDLALGCAEWVIDNMQDRKTGHFYFRKYLKATDKTAMLHWGQATMFKALSMLWETAYARHERS